MPKSVLLWAATLALLVNQCCAFAEEEVNSRSKTLLKVSGSTIEERLYLERCSQSSLHKSCVFAIDEDINQEPWSNECSSTTADMHPWFEARLESPAFVTKVVIYTVKNVGERGRDALTDFQLLAGRHACVRYRSYTSFENRTFSCDVFADYLRIQSNVQHAVLVLCEVVPFGRYVKFDFKSNGTTELKRHSCMQSSSLTEGNLCHKAMDNNFGQDGSQLECAKTMNERAPWWELRIKEPALIKRMLIYNRIDCCQDEFNNFEVSVDGQLCYKYDQFKSFAMEEFPCGRFGELIRIVSMKSGDKDQLTVCEVKVYGYPVLFQGRENYKYVGCYRERKNRRDLKKLAAINRMSLEKCERMCRREKGMDYFGLQQGRQCWCSDRYGMYGELDDESCWMPCDANPHQACGAKLVNSVFELAEREPERLSLPLVALNTSIVSSTVTTFGSGGVNITTSGKTTSSSKSSVTKTTNSTTP